MRFSWWDTSYTEAYPVQGAVEQVYNDLKELVVELFYDHKFSFDDEAMTISASGGRLSGSLGLALSEKSVLHTFDFTVNQEDCGVVVECTTSLKVIGSYGVWGNALDKMRDSLMLALYRKLAGR